MTKIIVTGGAGFIGSHLVDALVNEGHTVLAYDDLSGGDGANVHYSATLYIASLANAQTLDRAFATFQPEAVYHLAAYAAEGLSPHIMEFNAEANLVNSCRVINACIRHGVKRLVFTSSAAVYGNATAPHTESDVPSPIDPYGITKLAVEQHLAVARHRFGLETVAFRPHNVFGPRQRIGDTYRNAVGIWMNQCMRGTPLTIFGTGAQVREFCYIDDVIPTMVMAGTSPRARDWDGQVFNLGPGHAMPVRDMAKAVAEAMGVPIQFNEVPERKEQFDVRCDHTRQFRTFGPVRATDLGVALMAMANWARTKGPQTQTYFDHIELMQGLPEVWLPGAQSGA